MNTHPGPLCDCPTCAGQPEDKPFVPKYPLPRIALKLTHLHEAWIVGSAADPSRDALKTKDVDILVPYANWQQAAVLIPADAKPNCFGGWKFINDGRDVDVWPGDLGWLMTNAKAKWAWQPKHGIRLQKTLA